MPRSLLKLTFALAVLVLTVVCVAGVLVEKRLAERDRADLARSIEQRANLVRELTRGVAFDIEGRKRLDAVADRAGEAAGVRVTLIAADGAVVGDSAIPLHRLGDIESHADRPEILQARAGITARSIRRSTTVGREMLYVAIPAAAGTGDVVRLAVELDRAGGLLPGLGAPLLWTAAVGLAAAVALAIGLGRSALRPIREIRGLAAAIAAGDLDYRLPRRYRDELTEVERAIHHIADQLRSQLTETTREKEQLQGVLNGMTEGVLVVDRRRVIVLANHRLREFFGSLEDPCGRTPLESIRNAELDDMLAEAEASDEPVARVIDIAYPSHRSLRVQAVRIPAEPAERIGTVAVLHDVTELARLENVRSQFVANASHELRTPLAAIRGFAETLLGLPDLPEGELRSSIEVIDRHSRRLAALVSDLLELSSIESGTTRHDAGSVDMSDMVEALVREYRPRFAEKELEVSHVSKGDAIAWADPQAVEQILTNLLDNALQYTDQGGHIALRVEGDEQRVRVSVLDDGVGIPRRDLDRIFERFYRVDKARSRAQGGTGLGLAIAKHLAQNLGGDIAVDSELGRGSSFTLTLPRQL